MNQVAQDTPTAISTRLVLALIRAHIDGNEQQFKAKALEVAEELKLNGKLDLAHWVWAQYGLVRTFEVTD